MGVDKTDLKEENNNIYDNLQHDISELKQQGKRELLMGDFNGHITKNQERIGEWERDRNGERLINLVNQEALEIINFPQQGKGKWAWMRKNSKSLIDYIISQ